MALNLKKEVYTSWQNVRKKDSRAIIWGKDYWGLIPLRGEILLSKKGKMLTDWIKEVENSLGWKELTKIK